MPMFTTGAILVPITGAVPNANNGRAAHILPLRNCIGLRPSDAQKTSESSIAVNYAVNNRSQLFGSYTAVPIGPGVRNLNPATGVRPAFITLFPQ